MYSDTLYNVVSLTLYRDIFLCPHVHVCIQYRYKNDTTIHRCKALSCINFVIVWIHDIYILHARFSQRPRGPPMAQRCPLHTPARFLTSQGTLLKSFTPPTSLLGVVRGGTWPIRAHTAVFSIHHSIHYTSVLLPYTAEKAIHHRSIAAAHVTTGPYRYITIHLMYSVSDTSAIHQK